MERNTHSITSHRITHQHSRRTTHTEPQSICTHGTCTCTPCVCVCVCVCVVSAFLRCACHVQCSSRDPLSYVWHRSDQSTKHTRAYICQCMSHGQPAAVVAHVHVHVHVHVVVVSSHGMLCDVHVFVMSCSRMYSSSSSWVTRAPWNRCPTHDTCAAHVYHHHRCCACTRVMAYRRADMLLLVMLL